MSRGKQSMLGDRNLIMTVREYMCNKTVKMRTIFRIRGDGSTCYVVNGVELSEEEMNELFPTPVSLLSKHNCDTTRKYMQ